METAKAYQRTIRENESASEKSEIWFPTEQLKARYFDIQCETLTDEVRNFIKRYEWLGTIGFQPIKVITARYMGVLGGVVLFSNVYSYDSLVDGLSLKDYALVSRGACAGWTPKNLASRLIKSGCRQLKLEGKKVFIAYGDPNAGELGTVYQACGFDYLGSHFGDDRTHLVGGIEKNRRFLLYKGNVKPVLVNMGYLPEDSWFAPNGRLVFGRLPADIRAEVKVNLSLRIQTKKAPRKHKYALVLGLSKVETKMLLAHRLYPVQPYPKSRCTPVDRLTAHTERMA